MNGDKCLTANSADDAVWGDCVTDSLQAAQGWRVVTFEVQGIDALESLKFPGACAVLEADQTIMLCSCSNLAILVRCGFPFLCSCVSFNLSLIHI